MIITAKELNNKLIEDNIVIIDVSNKEEPFNTGRAVYENAHIPGAIFLDVKEDLTGKNSFVPDVDELAQTLSELGVSNEMTVVLYDRGTNRQVSKAYLVFTYIGHEHILVLQGGFAEWKKSGFEVTSEVPVRKNTKYIPNPNEEIISNIDYIKDQMNDESSTLIDSRAYERYTGKREPKYKKAGHIPGAKNYYSKDVLNGKLWKDKDQLEEHFSSLNKKQEVIVSCGSGNSACLNFLALKVAGFSDVKIYPGGFSEWIKDDENEVATDEE